MKMSKRVLIENCRFLIENYDHSAVSTSFCSSSSSLLSKRMRFDRRRRFTRACWSFYHHVSLLLLFLEVPLGS